MENKSLYGKRRSTHDCGMIACMAMLGVEYGVNGYLDDLYYYQGDDSIRKARRLAENMRPDLGETLIADVIKSNKAMEEAAQASSVTIEKM